MDESAAALLRTPVHPARLRPVPKNLGQMNAVPVHLTGNRWILLLAHPAEGCGVVVGEAHLTGYTRWSANTTGVRSPGSRKRPFRMAGVVPGATRVRSVPCRAMPCVRRPRTTSVSVRIQDLWSRFRDPARTGYGQLPVVHRDPLGGVTAVLQSAEACMATLLTGWWRRPVAGRDGKVIPAGSARPT